MILKKIFQPFFHLFLLINTIHCNEKRTLIEVASQDQSVIFCDNCNFYIGGLFPIHAPKSRDNSYSYLAKFEQQQQQKHENFLITTQKHSLLSTENTQTDALLIKPTCGEIKKERGIQRLEAMLYAIDLINNNTVLLPDIKLGAKIYDTCDRDTIALEKCLNFISDHVILNEENFANDFTCQSSGLYNMSGIVPVKNKEAIYKRKVVGVIGAASSSVSVQVANILRLFQVNIYCQKCNMLRNFKFYQTFKPRPSQKSKIFFLKLDSTNKLCIYKSRIE
jgi:hypothetical protein